MSSLARLSEFLEEDSDSAAVEGQPSIRSRRRNLDPLFEFDRHIDQAVARMKTPRDRNRVIDHGDRASDSDWLQVSREYRDLVSDRSHGNARGPCAYERHEDLTGLGAPSESSDLAREVHKKLAELIDVKPGSRVEIKRDRVQNRSDLQLARRRSYDACQRDWQGELLR